MQSQTVVITGARGYIGTALAQRLSAAGHALRLVSRSAHAPRVDAAPGHPIDYIVADLRDPQAWSRLLEDAAAVIHLSSRTDLRAAEADPERDRELNVEPVEALVRAAARRGAPVPVIFASTVTIYGIDPQLPVDETAPDRPCSVYDRHKLACEMILREATGLGVIRACSLRLANVYGYGDVVSSINTNRGILNAMTRRSLDGEPLTLYGDGAYVRDFIHLEDVVEAFRLAMAGTSICDGRSYVIATGRGHTLAEAYEMIAEAMLSYVGRRAEIRRVPEPAELQPIERRSFVGDSRLFKERAGWRPRFDLPSGLRDYFARAALAPVMAAEQ